MCRQPVRKILVKALRDGAAEPDHKDGLRSPKHAYNVDYKGNKNLWDPAIKKLYREMR